MILTQPTSGASPLLRESEFSPTSSHQPSLTAQALGTASQAPSSAANSPPKSSTQPSSTPNSTTPSPTQPLPLGMPSQSPPLASHRPFLAGPNSFSFHQCFPHELTPPATSRYTYQVWRPVTAIHYPDPWVASGRDISDPNWTPLLRPTPSHPDYVSTHSTFGGAASAVLRAWNRGDKIDATLSSNVTIDNRGVITRRIVSLKGAAEENSASRVFGGVSTVPYFHSTLVCWSGMCGLS